MGPGENVPGPMSEPANAKWPGWRTPTMLSSRAASTISPASPESPSPRAASPAGAKPPAAAFSTEFARPSGSTKICRPTGTVNRTRRKDGRHSGIRQRRLSRVASFFRRKTAAALSRSANGTRASSIRTVSNIEELDNYRKETGRSRISRAARRFRPDAIWDTECDILIPAALENQITLENCDRIRAKVLAEAANGPTTPGAEDALHARGIMIIPDIFLNAGGVTVSYFEWGKNLSHMRFGRLQKHLEEMRNQKLVGSIEKPDRQGDSGEPTRSFWSAGRRKSIW